MRAWSGIEIALVGGVAFEHAGSVYACDVDVSWTWPGIPEDAMILLVTAPPLWFTDLVASEDPATAGEFGTHMRRAPIGEMLSPLLRRWAERDRAYLRLLGPAAGPYDTGLAAVAARMTYFGRSTHREREVLCHLAFALAEVGQFLSGPGDDDQWWWHLRTEALRPNPQWEMAALYGWTGLVGLIGTSGQPPVEVVHGFVGDLFTLADRLVRADMAPGELATAFEEIVRRVRATKQRRRPPGRPPNDSGRARTLAVVVTLKQALAPYYGRGHGYLDLRAAQRALREASDGLRQRYPELRSIDTPLETSDVLLGLQEGRKPRIVAERAAATMLGIEVESVADVWRKHVRRFRQKVYTLVRRHGIAPDSPGPSPR